MADLRPPKELTLKGEHPNGCKTITLEVTICEDANGMVWSTHDFQDSKEDVRIAMLMRGCGVQAIGYSLLIEAFRREAYTSMLAELTADKEYLQKYHVADEAGRAQIEKSLAASIRHVAGAVILKSGEDISREILHMALSQTNNV